MASGAKDGIAISVRIAFSNTNNDALSPHVRMKERLEALDARRSVQIGPFQVPQFPDGEHCPSPFSAYIFSEELFLI